MVRGRAPRARVPERPNPGSLRRRRTFVASPIVATKILRINKTVDFFLLFFFQSRFVTQSCRKYIGQVKFGRFFFPLYIYRQHSLRHELLARARIVPPLGSTGVKQRLFFFCFIFFRFFFYFSLYLHVTVQSASDAHDTCYHYYKAIGV